MSDDRYDADGELLSAWLAGDLDPQGSDEVERRLSAEPELSTRLDRVHDTLIALRGLDDVAPPPGAAERLRARLDAEQPHPAPVASLERARRRRASRLPVLGAVAAVVAILALIPVLSRPGAESTTDQVALEDAPELSVEAAGGEAAAPQQLQEASEAAAEEAAGPLVFETGPDRLSARAGDSAPALLGLPVEQAERLSAEYAAAIAAAPPFEGLGVAPGACLDAVLAELEVPVQVEGARRGDRPVLTYTLVSAAPGSVVLDSTRVTTVDAETCAPA